MRVLERENRKAPNQHRTFSSCRRKRAPPPLPRSCSCISTSTPKPRAEGSSPSAPAKNREVSTMLASLFFVSGHKGSATRSGRVPRGACRGVSERQWRSAANRLRRQPRQVLLPLPKTALLLLQWRCFLSLGGTSWQRGTAAPREVRVVG